MRRLLLGVLLLLFAGAASATPTTVAGTLYLADGTTLANGTVTLDWTNYTAADGKFVPAGRKVIAVTAGVFSQALEPSTTSTPTFAYRVTYRLGSQAPQICSWTVGVSTPTTISSIESCPAVISAAPAILPLTQLATGGGVDGYCLTLNSGVWAPAACGSTAGIGGFTAGSVLFVGSGPVFAQDNANFYYDATLHNLGLGGAPGAYKLDISKSGTSGTFRFYDQTASTGSTLGLIKAGAGQSGDLLDVAINDGTVNSGFGDVGQVFAQAGGVRKLELYPSTPSALILSSDSLLYWKDNVASNAGTPDTGLGRNAAGVLEVNNGTLGTYRDVIMRNLTLNGLTSGASQCLHVDTAGVVSGTGSDCGSGGGGSGITALTGDVTASGSGSVAATVVNLPTGVTMAGYLAATAIVAPGTPAAGVGRIYVDSTSKNLAVKDDAGVVKHGVQTDAGTAHNFLTAISDAGLISKAQPSCADLSDSGTGCAAAAGITALTGDVTGTGPGSTATTVGKVNGVAYGASPSTNTVPVVTGANTVTYEAVPNAALANSSLTVNGSGCLGNAGAISLGSTGTVTSANCFNITTANTLTAVVAPATPSAGFGAAYFDSTTRVLSSKNSTGTVSNTVVPDTGAAHNFLTAISTSGVISKAQPACGDLSDAGGACTQSIASVTNLLAGNGSGSASDSGIAASTVVKGAASLSTAGAVPYVASAGTLSQDASNILWDSTNHCLNIGAATGCGTNNVAVYVQKNGTAILAKSGAGFGSFWATDTTDANQSSAFIFNQAGVGKVEFGVDTTNNPYWYDSRHTRQLLYSPTGGDLEVLPGGGALNITTRATFGAFGSTDDIGLCRGATGQLNVNDGSTTCTNLADLAAANLLVGTSPPACTGGTSGGGCFNEGTAPTGAAGVDDIYADSTAHRLMMINNNGTAETVGNVTGPASSTTENCVKFADTTGKVLADAGAACGSGSGGTAVAPYTTTETTQTSVTITAATHGQGTLATPWCFDNSTPRVAVSCAYTRATNGDLVFTFSPAFTGLIEIGSGGGIDVTPYSASETTQTSVSITAATHGKGTTPVATCLDGSTPRVVVACNYTRASNGDLAFTFSPAFTGVIEVRP